MLNVSAFQRREAFLVLRLDAAILMLKPSSGDHTSSERGLMPNFLTAFTPAPLGVEDHYHLISLLHSPHRGASGLRNTAPRTREAGGLFSIAHQLLSTAPSREAYS